MKRREYLSSSSAFHFASGPFLTCRPLYLFSLQDTPTSTRNTSVAPTSTSESDTETSTSTSTRTTTSTRTSTTTTTRSTSTFTPTPTTIFTTTAIVTPTIIIISPSFSPTTITTTSTVLITGSTVSTPTSTSQSNNGGFFDNKGAVGGVFAVVGIVAALLIAGLIWLCLRRRRQKQMDADVMAAASAAAAHNRTPFDYDDDDDPEMIEGPNSYPPRVPTPGAQTAYNAGTIGSSYNYAPEGYEPSHFSAGTGPGYAGMGAFGPTAAAAGAGAGAGAFGAYYAGQAHDGASNDPYAQYAQQHPDQHSRQASYGGQPWGAPAGSGGSPPSGSPPMDPNHMPNPYANLSPGAGHSPPLAPSSHDGTAGVGAALVGAGANSASSHQYLHSGPGAASNDTDPTAMGHHADAAPAAPPKDAVGQHEDGLEDDDEPTGRPDPRFMMNQEHTGSQASLRDDQDYSRRLGL
ncbi:hypothetical protein CF327_g4525 [Tilletia walkeri]|uniref:Uncharacterized protein n=1 Tax=Tilletia walkeri TaxID=117179 RepID=A0A8X7T548_9BASI|nr:hypothetical protein CF327_g4525 [Tilletia walkeri]KAE8269126.1 hypothetical protein A4X09_0g3211 [Tilletia walkeri]